MERKVITITSNLNRVILYIVSRIIKHKPASYSSLKVIEYQMANLGLKKSGYYVDQVIFLANSSHLPTGKTSFLVPILIKEILAIIEGTALKSD